MMDTDTLRCAQGLTDPTYWANGVLPLINDLDDGTEWSLSKFVDKH